MLKKIKTPTAVRLFTKTWEKKIYREFGIVYRLSTFSALLHFDKCPVVVAKAKSIGLADEYFNKLPTYAGRVEDTPLLVAPKTREYYLRFMYSPPNQVKRRYINEKGRPIKAEVVKYEKQDPSSPSGAYNDFVYTVIRLDSIRTLTVDGMVYELRPTGKRPEQKLRNTGKSPVTGAQQPLSSPGNAS